MAHDGTGTGWDETSPANTDPRRAGAQEIRDLRRALRLREKKEHVEFDVDTAGGEHKAGSAMAYYQATAPTLRPDGETALDTDDAGRVWVDSDDNRIYHWDGTQWLLVSSLVDSGTLTVPSDGSYSSYVTTTVIPRVLILDGPSGVNATVRTSDGTVDVATSRISGTDVIGVAYEVNMDFAGKRFRMRQHSTATAGPGGSFRYAIFG